MSAKSVEQIAYEEALLNLMKKCAEQLKELKQKNYTVDRAHEARLAVERERIAELRARKYDHFWMN